jgi:hypothetical protein
MWIFVLIAVLVALGLASGSVARRSSLWALMAILAFVGYHAVSGHLL